MPRPKRRQADLPEATELRIIGGSMRGRKLRYEPFMDGADPVTRPMKHRVREAIFNLVSTECAGRHAFDLFAGTGALGLEALSRGALRATFIEKHVPTARVIQANIADLGVEDRSELLATSAFLWGKRDLPKGDGSWEKGECGAPDPLVPPAGLPWLVFCSPPYAFFVDRRDEMLELIGAVIHHAPAGSIVIVEADDRFDFTQLPGGVAVDRRAEGWQMRTYMPAVVGVLRT
ncbi:MAG: RsmD family RNA methyltransferase [Pirellulales bacterium]|nr:RsmD family RNA methyltransferase [Pirellulales bacterium]